MVCWWLWGRWGGAAARCSSLACLLAWLCVCLLAAKLLEISSGLQGFEVWPACLHGCSSDRLLRICRMSRADCKVLKLGPQGFAKLGERRRRDVVEGARVRPSGSKRRGVFDVQERK